MAPRGLKPTQAEFDGLRAELRGKKVIGTAAVFTAFGMFRKAGFVVTVTLTQPPKRSCRSCRVSKETFMDDDGNWHSYDWLGPSVTGWHLLLTSWITLLASVSRTSSLKKLPLC